MKVRLIVVQGKPEGMIIPLQTPTFKIGRGENCHLRPNSEEVSREHAEFSITADKVILRDLGSRNGTIVNNQILTAPRTLKDRDLIQVGALTFAISIEGAPVPTTSNGPEVRRPEKASPDDVSNADIDSWLIADAKSPTPDRPSGVYTGETKQYDTSDHGKASKPGTPAGNGTGDVEEAAHEGETSELPVDASNPDFGMKPKPSVKPAYKDSSDAASDILKKLMERRRVPH
jgi:predicted component of type VI protein secretion system